MGTKRNFIVSGEINCGKRYCSIKYERAEYRIKAELKKYNELEIVLIFLC